MAFSFINSSLNSQRTSLCGCVTCKLHQSQLHHSTSTTTMLSSHHIVITSSDCGNGCVLARSVKYRASARHHCVCHRNELLRQSKPQSLLRTRQTEQERTISCVHTLLLKDWLPSADMRGSEIFRWSPAVRRNPELLQPVHIRVSIAEHITIHM
jgi:hypothetical protein